jgi:signal transduction histidine kinase
MFGFSRTTAERAELSDAASAALEEALAFLDLPVLLIGPDGVVRSASPAAARALGERVEALRGRPREEVLPGGERAPRAVAHPLESAPGLSLVVLAVESASADHAARLAKLNEGLRALSVISHKINNPLTALLGRTQILRAKSQGNPTVEKAAQVVEESASRIADLARELSRTLRDCRQESVDAILASETGSSPSAEAN